MLLTITDKFYGPDCMKGRKKKKRGVSYITSLRDVCNWLKGIPSCGSSILYAETMFLLFSLFKVNYRFYNNLFIFFFFYEINRRKINCFTLLFTYFTLRREGSVAKNFIICESRGCDVVANASFEYKDSEILIHEL
ncbi:hypothetical protein PUN28_011705 [Cardiocondyla obscurior]|uniref:Uncharacterized protein n=1 Tax=Cardiocondyla obscurior TaxID=286306 RepID=A0AAW2FHK3_9HYME